MIKYLILSLVVFFFNEGNCNSKDCDVVMTKHFFQCFKLDDAKLRTTDFLAYIEAEVTDENYLAVDVRGELALGVRNEILDALKCLKKSEIEKDRIAFILAYINGEEVIDIKNQNKKRTEFKRQYQIDSNVCVLEIKYGTTKW